MIKYVPKLHKSLLVDNFLRLISHASSALHEPNAACPNVVKLHSAKLYSDFWRLFSSIFLVEGMGVGLKVLALACCCLNTVTTTTYLTHSKFNIPQLPLYPSTLMKNNSYSICNHRMFIVDNRYSIPNYLNVKEVDLWLSSIWC